MMDIISSALDANQFAPDDVCLVSTLDAQEQLQQWSSSLGIWHFWTEEGNVIVIKMCNKIDQINSQV